MVYVPTRGDVPVRLGPGVPITPGYGPSAISRQPYTDPVQFELERERVLNTTWLIAGRSSELAGTGDWLSFESHGETAVVTRQADGSLAAFHNVCQHRGPTFVTEWKGCGAKRFTCPYHGWMYDTTGKVSASRRRSTSTRSSCSDLRAPAVAADEWGGWVWVNLAGPDAAPPLREWIGDDIMDDLGRYRMEDMVLLEVLEWDVPVSYKAIVDGFNEIYHTASLHHVGAGVDEVGQGHDVPRRQRPQLHVLRPPPAVPRRAGRGLGPPPVRHLPLRRVPEHGLQLQPRAHPGVQPDPDRRRPHPLPLLGARLPRRRRRPRVRRLQGSACSTTGSTSRSSSARTSTSTRSWRAPSGRAPTQRNILSSREFKIAHYHELMAQMIRD